MQTAPDQGFPTCLAADSYAIFYVFLDINFYAMLAPDNFCDTTIDGRLLFYWAEPTNVR
ncbi:hypothetical protein CRENPOLYSF2_420023 [Crenothrix polyspora]|uniref:Uncharacterized protein n=1 Tax=Crenothrix polyspora TaxID=360316 RepID=A0A1R4HFQ9_9GAMM|nr:hypothetical protein CRENPOLYSF2_420023 [Crenothrix polyspora]